MECHFLVKISEGGLQCQGCHTDIEDDDLAVGIKKESARVMKYYHPLASCMERFHESGSWWSENAPSSSKEVDGYNLLDPENKDKLTKVLSELKTASAKGRAVSAKIKSTRSETKTEPTDEGADVSSSEPKKKATKKH